MFYWRATVPAAGPGGAAVELAFTSRGAARGRGPYAGLNLGGHVGDDPGVVEANRRRLAAALGVPRRRLLFLDQVHGRTVVQASGPWETEPPQGDGAVTAVPGLALGVLVADCVPLLLHDARAGVVAAVHAGRPGMMAGIATEAVRRMRGLGAHDVHAVVGPSVCARCYEVPAELAEAAAAVSPASAARSWSGTPAVDVAAGAIEQLAAEGVAVQRIPGCTREHDDLYSYRRDGTTGRFAGVIVLRRRPQGLG
ncbi:MAG TPA: peptidoglycan editing factor PgeF [Intrasporangium sp.]|uniref:peptidoglycan editing factor PgeF n=1 Tax=Intrasporangium sp. TaxID=1925024 RepID=UPI002D777366|nr:peptidoglycan editing factor PgeF [Intrasporangium sp.]HET7398522.1 peptidoglycan editing factor PgeF [Intrasporangium sp.]